ncbi:MAG: spore maturation protein [Clostridia bacterium]|nr:spore maturation protein [Clostridia bacterium]
MQFFSSAAIPFTIAFIIFLGLYRGVPVFDAFLSGAKNGLKTSITILPSIIGLVCAVSMLRASGATDLLCHGLSCITEPLGFPTEVLPLSLLRPISGGASTAVLNDILNAYGPDSFAGRVASVIAGASETTLYTLAVYFASVKAKQTRHTLLAALLGSLFCMIASVIAVRLFLS